MTNLSPTFFLLPLLLIGEVKCQGTTTSLNVGGAGLAGGTAGQDGKDDGLQAEKLMRLPMKPNYPTNFKGEWKIHNPNAGVSAMQLQLMPTGKLVWFDTTNLGPSDLKFDPPFCRQLPNNPNLPDCFAHAIEYDSYTGKVRPLKLMSDPWCSCGGLAANGDLINIGGALEAMRAVRLYTSCDTCDFKENVVATAENRWYSSQTMLPDGSFAVFGGRDIFSYEIVPANQLQFPTKLFPFPFFQQTRDEKENNIYPFANLLPDGNIYLFANNKSLILNPWTAEIIRWLPELPGGSRNYPASGMSVLLPLDLTGDYASIKVEVMVCGGNTHDALKFSEFEPRTFIPALNDCNRIVLSQPNPFWDREEMPSPRCMGDAQILPNGDVLMHNGAKAGTAAWEAADDANLVPVLYHPNFVKGQRFEELNPTTIARMYHSSSALLPEGTIIVTGSNPHQFYTFNVKYPTELRVEKFSPPYLDPLLDPHRPVIFQDTSDKEWKYGGQFTVNIKLADVVDQSDIRVTIYPPPFTTHGYSQGQRLLILKLLQVSNQQIQVQAPKHAKVAPPGYYMLFVVNRGVPSQAMWVHLM